MLIESVACWRWKNILNGISARITLQVKVMDGFGLNFGVFYIFVVYVAL